MALSSSYDSLRSTYGEVLALPAVFWHPTERPLPLLWTPPLRFWWHSPAGRRSSRHFRSGREGKGVCACGIEPLNGASGRVTDDRYRYYSIGNDYPHNWASINVTFVSSRPWNGKEHVLYLARFIGPVEVESQSGQKARSEGKNRVGPASMETVLKGELSNSIQLPVSRAAAPPSFVPV
ncbi:hypothetical protein RRG08_035847 [Elysia crispata]|uniref:Uncharacterized protein n=1 Tax=Elysia crispata TaxID=231223 RepID=A0AAE0Z5T6_9GAST|nr:hypothetical protein RRG08_035847 [Elysia crispata]